MKRFRGGLVFKAHKLCVSLNSRLESNKERENLRHSHVPHGGVRPFHQKSTCPKQLTLGPCVVQIWSRAPRNSAGSNPAYSTEWMSWDHNLRYTGYDRLRVGWLIGSSFIGRGATRAEDAQGTSTQSHISPSILVYENKPQCHNLPHP